MMESATNNEHSTNLNDQAGASRWPHHNVMTIPTAHVDAARITSTRILVGGRARKGHILTCAVVLIPTVWMTPVVIRAARSVWTWVLIPWLVENEDTFRTWDRHKFSEAEKVSQGASCIISRGTASFGVADFVFGHGKSVARVLWRFDARRNQIMNHHLRLPN